MSEAPEYAEEEVKAGTPSAVPAKSCTFALRIVDLARRLRKQHEHEPARQVLRAGTSIGANGEEAQAGTTHADFVAKMSIASKEARETHYWLRMIRDSEILPPDRLVGLMGDIEELARILTAIVKTGNRVNQEIPASKCE